MKSSTIVIVGAGSAGLAAAYTVCKHSNVSRVILVEASDRVGGHAWTVKTPGGEEVDMGFMVLNDVTYPNMLRVYREIGAEVEKGYVAICPQRRRFFMVIPRNFTVDVSERGGSGKCGNLYGTIKNLQGKLLQFLQIQKNLKI